MTAITTIAIVLALFLGSAIAIAVRKHYEADNLRKKVESLQVKINDYRDASIEPVAFYLVQRVVTDNPEFRKYNGCWGVCRQIYKRGYIFTTTIKVFTDDDDDFNLREAEELCEILNAK